MNTHTQSERTPTSQTGTAPEAAHHILHEWRTPDAQTVLVTYNGRNIHINEWLVKPTLVPLLIDALKKAHSLAVLIDGAGQVQAALAAAGGNPAHN